MYYLPPPIGYIRYSLWGFYFVLNITYYKNVRIWGLKWGSVK